MLEAAQNSRDHAQAKLDGIPYQVETEKVTRLRAQLTQTEEEAAQLSGRLLEQRKSVERIKGDTLIKIAFFSVASAASVMGRR